MRNSKPFNLRNDLSLEANILDTCGVYFFLLIVIFVKIFVKLCFNQNFSILQCYNNLWKIKYIKEYFEYIREKHFG